MKTIPINKTELVRLMKLCFRFDKKFTSTVKYLLGAKAKMDAIPGVSFVRVDCSGFVRWLIHGAAKCKVTMPDGSWNQNEWCKQQGFKRTHYLNCALKDDILRIAFIKPNGKKAGHVFLCINGQTIESYYGHGTGRRKWDTPVLIKNVSDCYVLTEPLL